MIDAAIWSTLDYSRVPYRLYHDPELYAREQEAIFRGPVWNYLALDAEIPNPAISALPGSATHQSSSTVTVTASSRRSLTAAPIAAPWCGASRREMPLNTSASIISGATVSMGV